MAEATQAAAKSVACFFNPIRTEISHLPTLDVVPDAFSGIEVGCVARQPLHREPIPMAEEELFHVAAAMCGQVVPDEDDFLAADEALELFEEVNQAGGVVAVGLGAGE